MWKPHKTPQILFEDAFKNTQEITSGYIPDFAHWKKAEGLLEQDVGEGQIKHCCVLPVAQVGCEHYSKLRDSLIFLQYTVLTGPWSHLFLLKGLLFLLLILLPICNLITL